MNGTKTTAEGTPGRDENGGGIDTSRPSHEEQLIDELIFKQELNEVHMLIDFVSGRTDRSLRDLSIPHRDDPTKTMGSGDIMKSIAEMRYPPTGTRTANARNAFILLLAREQLSALAAPASPRTSPIPGYSSTRKASPGSADRASRVPATRAASIWRGKPIPGYGRMRASFVGGATGWRCSRWSGCC